MTATPHPRREPLALPNQMTATDALFWYAEAANSGVRPIVGGLCILDRHPDERRFRAGYEALLALVPRLRQRVAEPPLSLGLPSWVDDDHLDLSYHLRHLSLPKPGGMRALLDLTATLLGTPLDHQRPPWETYWIDGLGGGKSAYFFKMHHSLADGVGSVALFDLMTTARRDDPFPRLRARPAAAAPLEGQGPAAMSLASIGAGMASATIRLVRGSAETALEILAHPIDAFESLTRTVAVVRGVLSDISNPATRDPLARSAAGLSRRLDVHRVPMKRLRALADALGVTMNDVVLTALSAALGAYHRERSMEVATLNCMVPVNLRGSAEREALGNRVGMLNVALPVGEMSLQGRLQRIHEQTSRGKRDERGRGYPLLFESLAFLPNVGLRWITRASLARINVVCTNIPGLPERRFMAGAEVEAWYPFVSVVEGVPLMMALLSYAGSIEIGLDTDPEAIPDPHRITVLFEQALEELRSSAPRQVAGGKYTRAT
jgi:WS/DGAT/MGAT family acyltransferase